MAKGKKTTPAPKAVAETVSGGAIASPPAIQSEIIVAERANGHIMYRQDEVDKASARKILDTLLDTPPGTGIHVTLATNGRVFEFPVDTIDVGTVVRQYNGIKIRKAK